MNDTPTHEAVNLAGAHWNDRQGRGRAFGAARPGFGVREIATGRFLAHDSEHPSTWSRKSVAAVHAQSPTTTITVAVTFR